MTVEFSPFLPENYHELRFDHRHRMIERQLERETLNLLDADEARWLFMFLWRDNQGLCQTCGADEGRCTDGTCIRTRVTNKLALTRKWGIQR
jgi:hypothetical protein